MASIPRTPDGDIDWAALKVISDKITADDPLYREIYDRSKPMDRRQGEALHMRMGQIESDMRAVTLAAHALLDLTRKLEQLAELTRQFVAFRVETTDQLWELTEDIRELKATRPWWRRIFG